MMDAIEFLEQLGRNARLRHAAPAELERALAATGIDPELRSALLADDALRLGELLGAQPNVCCLIVKPDPRSPTKKKRTRTRRGGRQGVRLRAPRSAAPCARHPSRLDRHGSARRSCRADSRCCARCSRPRRSRSRRRKRTSCCGRLTTSKASIRRSSARSWASSTSSPRRSRSPSSNILQYLKGWRSAYAGDYARAIPPLEQIIEESRDVTLRFRASATVANVQAVATHYDEAFAQLGRLLTLLPQVTDKDARQQGLLVIGYLYNQVGEYDLGLSYADRIARRGYRRRARCAAAISCVWKRSIAAAGCRATWRSSSTPSRPATQSARCCGRTRSASTSRAPTSTRDATRRDQAAEQLLRRDPRHALSPADLANTNRGWRALTRTAATRRRRASSRCARSATRASRISTPSRW